MNQFQKRAMRAGATYAQACQITQEYQIKALEDGASYKQMMLLTKNQCLAMKNGASYQDSLKFKELIQEAEQCDKNKEGSLVKYDR